MEMHRTTVIIPQDLLARKAANLVDSLSQLRCNVWIRKGDAEINGKSLVGLLHLHVNQGEEIVITTDGAEEEHRRAVLFVLEA